MLFRTHLVYNGFPIGMNTICNCCCFMANLQHLYGREQKQPAMSERIESSWINISVINSRFTHRFTLLSRSALYFVYFVWALRSSLPNYTTIALSFSFSLTPHRQCWNLLICNNSHAWDEREILFGRGFFFIHSPAFVDQLATLPFTL